MASTWRSGGEGQHELRGGLSESGFCESSLAWG